MRAGDQTTGCPAATSRLSTSSHTALAAAATRVALGYPCGCLTVGARFVSQIASSDTAIAAAKQIAGPVAGHANVLIFPDLNSGNIAFKLIQLLAGANTFGQIVLGLSRPAAEISRGASAHDVFGAAAVVGVQAIDRRLLYGTP